MLRLYLLCLLLAPVVGGSAPGEYENPQGFKLDNSWIVWLREGAEKSPNEHSEWATSIHNTWSGGLVGITSIFDFETTGARGYTGEFTDYIIDTIRENEDVEGVTQQFKIPGPGLWKPVHAPPVKQEEQLNVNFTYGYSPDNDSRRPGPSIPHEIPDGESSARASGDQVEQTDAQWSLSRISKSPIGKFRYPRDAGAGTFIYILDSGIDRFHDDFEGRTESGHDASLMLTVTVRDPLAQTMVHGTHVASVAAGYRYGVAKNATVVDVKVLRDLEEPDYPGFAIASLDGIEWAIRDIVAKDRVGRSVIHISFGVRQSLASKQYCKVISQAVERAIDKDIPVIIAAGNANVNAQEVCPGNTARAITVGAVDRKNRRAAETPIFNQTGGWESNWGDMIDIYAPGVYIQGALAGSVRNSTFEEGTALAAAHVTGVVATMLSQLGPLKPDKIKKKLLDRAEQAELNMWEVGLVLYNGQQEANPEW